MSAISIAYALLSGAAAVTAITSTRIYPVELPEGVALPAIVMDLISNVREGAIDAAASRHVTRARVQVSLLTSSYTQQESLRNAVVAAMQFQRGAIGGESVISVLKGPDGPTSFDAGMGDVYHHPVDFFLTFYEA